MGFHYPPSLRLRSKRDYDNVLKLRKRLYGRYFLAYYRSNELLHPRLGVITAKRNVKLAVFRNRTKRMLKEHFRLAQAELPNLDIVFIAKKGVEQAANQELKRCIEHLLQQLTTKAKK